MVILVNNVLQWKLDNLIFKSGSISRRLYFLEPEMLNHSLGTSQFLYVARHFCFRCQVPGHYPAFWKHCTSRCKRKRSKEKNVEISEECSHKKGRKWIYFLIRTREIRVSKKGKIWKIIFFQINIISSKRFYFNPGLMWTRLYHLFGFLPSLPL